MQQKVKKPKMKISPVRLLVILLCGLLLGLCVYLVNAGLGRRATDGAPPMPFGIGAGVVLSGSMEPALRVDDLIFFRASDAYRVGDVVVYYGGGMAVVHRVINVSGSDITTQGDANNAADDPVSASDVCGTVIGRLPGGGVAVSFMQSPTGMILILAAAILLLELSFRGEKRQGDREIEEIKAEIRRLRQQESGGANETRDGGDA